MNYFSWLAQEEDLSSAGLTVRAQAINPNNVPGRLFHDLFFPRRNVDEIELAQISTVDFRPVSDRREWDLEGRLIPFKTPDTKKIEMTPIESFFAIRERELYKLVERTNGNEQVFRELIGVSLPARTDDLVFANLRRIERDAFNAWALKTITAMNPETGLTETFTFSFAAGRYQTAGTAWNNVAVNAYDEFVAWLEDGVDNVGSAVGAIMRKATYKEIQKDAPVGVNNIKLTRGQLADRIEQDLGVAFSFYIFEQTVHEFTDAGLATASVNLWPTQRVALVPEGVAVGNIAYAPVIRARELAKIEREAEIDIRGQTVVTEIENAGRGLRVMAQVNALPVPDEQKMWVINAGV